jgi:hypothetical protein
VPSTHLHQQPPRRRPGDQDDTVTTSTFPDEALVTTEPRRFFRPQPSTSGTFATWIGVYLDLPGDDAVDWDEIAAILGEAYRLVGSGFL